MGILSFCLSLFSLSLRDGKKRAANNNSENKKTNSNSMASKRATGGKYEYLSLAELYQLEERMNVKTQRAHIYGIVAEKYQPQITRSGDTYLKLKLFDESLNSDYVDEKPRKGMKRVNPPFIEIACFANNKEDLPILAQVGDVIRFHRLEVSFYRPNSRNNQYGGGREEGTIQFVAKIGQFTRGNAYSKTHFVLFSGEPAQIVDADSAKQKSSNDITFTDEDQQRIENLIAWKNTPECLGMPKIAYLGKYDRRIQDIQRERNYDLHVKILDVGYRDGYPEVIFVWDGSDAAPMSLSTPDFPQLVDEAEIPGPMYWLPIDQDVNPTQDVIERGQDFPPSTRRMLEEMGDAVSYGSAFPVYIRGFDFSDEMPKKGQWVKLRNLTAGVHGAQLNGAFFANSKWMVEARGHPTWLDQVQFRQKANIVANWAPNVGVDSPNITMIKHPQVKWDTIRSALLKEAPNRHRLYVRVQSFWPEDEKQWCVKNPVTNEWEYVFKMLVEDATGILRVTVSPEEGKYFFRGLPPCDLSANRATLHQLRTRKHTLLNGSNGTDNWIQICVRQYLPARKRTRNEKRTWELFGTAMVREKL